VVQATQHLAAFFQFYNTEPHLPQGYLVIW